MVENSDGRYYFEVVDQDISEVLPLAGINRPAEKMQFIGVSSWIGSNGKELLQVSKTMELQLRTCKEGCCVSLITGFPWLYNMDRPAPQCPLTHTLTASV